MSQDIKDIKDWYRVKVTELKQVGGGALFSRYGSLPLLLGAVYPEYLIN